MLVANTSIDKTQRGGAFGRLTSTFTVSVQDFIEIVSPQWDYGLKWFVTHRL